MESLLAIDIGFDPRAHDMLVRLTNWRDGVKYHPDRDSCMVTATFHSPDMETIAETLAKAGYSIVIAQTANGRDVQCTPQSAAPAADKPGYDWTGPAWAVQAKNDNYWCVGPSLAAVLTRSGWGADEIRTIQ